MGIFSKKKRSVDVLDLTDMQRRGLLKKEDVRQAPLVSATTEGFVDFSSSSTDPTSSQSQFNDSSSFTNSNQTSPAGDFLSNFADIGNSTLTENSITDNLRDARKKNLVGNEVNELKIKLDDAEFKISSLTQRVAELERLIRER
jgi:hypothetical protein